MENRFKFKFYDKTRNILEYIHTWDFEHGIIQYIDNKGDIKDLKITKNVVIIQSTGLFDVNGKEIFEGDIVRYYTPNDKSVIDYIITYDYKEAKYLAISRYYEITCKISEKWLKSKEIIGNIYQNKELLGE